MSSSGRPETGAQARPTGAGQASAQGEPASSFEVPMPDDGEKAPPADLCTIRVTEVHPEGRMFPFFWGRAYQHGVEVGEVKARTKEAALAGALADVEKSWRHLDSKKGLKDGR